MAAELTKTERMTLQKLERVVEQGMATFHDVGVALRQIREDQLYRETHGTWAEYCRGRWNFSPQHAGRLMSTIEPIGSIQDDAAPEPEKESHVRELTRLPDDERPAAWRDACHRAASEGRSVTAGIVREVVDEHIAAAEPEADAEPETPRDALGNAIDDEEVAGVFAAAGILADLISRLRAVKKGLKASATAPVMAAVDVALADKDLRNAIAALKDGLPYCVAPASFPVADIAQRGWMTKRDYELASQQGMMDE